MSKKERMLKLLRDGNVLSPKSLEERGIKPCPVYRELVMEGNEIYRVNLTIKKGVGSIKYRKNKFLKQDTPQIVYCTDTHVLSDYLKNIFRFKLTPNLDSNLKKVVTRYLRGRVPEETLKELKSLYLKK